MQVFKTLPTLIKKTSIKVGDEIPLIYTDRDYRAVILRESKSSISIKPSGTFCFSLKTKKGPFPYHAEKGFPHYNERDMKHMEAMPHKKLRAFAAEIKIRQSKSMK